MQLTQKSPVALLAAFALALGVVQANPFRAQDAPAKDARQEPSEKPQEKPKLLEIGSTVPEGISLMSLDGKATSFKDLRGKIVILHFWSDRCPAERHADPVFKAMEERYAKDKDVVMVAIAANQNELGEAPGKDADYSKFYGSLRKKAASVGYTHTILADHGNRVSDLFQARTTPHCFVIDAKGVLLYSGALDNDPSGKKGAEATNYLDEAVVAIKAGKRPETTSTRPYG